MSCNGDDVEVGSLITNKDIKARKRNVVFQWICCRRNMIAVMGLISTTLLSILRINLSIAIVAMTKNFPRVMENGTVIIDVQELEWSSEDQGKILSSFFYGYVTTSCVGGWMGARYGGAKMMTVGLIASSLVTFLTPVLANNSIYIVMSLRILLGVAQGLAIPAMMSIWTYWATPETRTGLVTISIGGIPFGAFTGLSVCGFISEYFGWRSVFFVTGGVSIIWSIIWFSFVKEKPQDDPWVKKEQLSCFVPYKSIPEKKKKSAYPYRQIFTSLPLWALITVGFCSGFGHYTLQMELPTFFMDAFNFQLSKTGLLASLPDVFFFMTYIGSGNVSDAILKRGILTSTQVRKLFACGALFIQAILIMLITLTSDCTIIVLLFTFIKFLKGFAYSSIDVGPMDIAPKYAGIVFGISNTSGLLAGSMGPTFCGLVVDNKSRSEWNTVFLTISGFYLAGSIIYGMFGSAEVQPWALPTFSKDEEDKVFTKK